MALLRVINTPARGIGKATIERLAAHATRHGTSLLDAARGVRDITAISARSAKLVHGFVAIFDRLAAVAGGPIEELLGNVLTETAYEEQWSKSTDPDDEERLANVRELLTVAREFDERHPGTGHLEAFLEETALVNDTDDWETTPDRVTLDDARMPRRGWSFRSSSSWPSRRGCCRTSGARPTRTNWRKNGGCFSWASPGRRKSFTSAWRRSGISAASARRRCPVPS